MLASSAAGVPPLMVGSSLAGQASDDPARVSVVKTPLTAGANDYYVGNRVPLLPSPLIKLPIGAIEPRGWLRQQLLDMVNGMTGQLANFSNYLHPVSGWMTMGENDVGWEEIPYWLRGYGDLGYVLAEQKVSTEARRWLDAALNSQQPDGYFGPPLNKKNNDLWPNMLMLNAFQSLHEWSGDKRVLEFMSHYFRYELNLPVKKLLPESWQKIRGGDNLASVYWLYNRTGEAWLLDLAKHLHQQTSDWTSGLPTPHGVNIAQGFREPATYYQQSKDRKFLEATGRDYRLVRDEYGQVPGGLYAADENCRQGYTGASQGSETCAMVEFMHSAEMLLKITGDPLWADRCEDVAFNMLPAACTPDLKGLHYLTAPNLAQCDPAFEHVFENVGYMLPFSPREIYRCCQHNVSFGWPYYAEHLWMATLGNGLAALFYAPCTVTAQVGQGARVKIEEETDYPFGETIEFKLTASDTVQFPLLIRIPGWCEKATVEINGRSFPAQASPDTYLVLERAWKDGDRVALHLPANITLTTWARQSGGISVERGPLSFSLKIGQRWEKIGGTEEWPELAVYPTTPWNVALAVDRSAPAASFRVEQKPLRPGQPFDQDSAPVELRAKGRVVPDWTLVKNTAGPVPPSPVKTDQPELDITLIPMGCARLRTSVFPTT